MAGNALMFTLYFKLQIGFVLYPLNGGPPWDLADHNNIMFLTMCFCWHYATAIVITGAIYAFVTW